MTLVRISAQYRAVTCGDCGREFVTKFPRQKFCDVCGPQRRRASSHSYGAKSRAALAESRPRIAATIAERSAGTTRSLADAFADRQHWVWKVEFAVPFSLNASKNRRWSNTGRGTVFLSSAVRAYQDELIILIKKALSTQPIRNTKLWIGLFVQKNNHRSDAINVIDTICDAIKKAANLDDRWFCIDRLDWEISKTTTPQIYVRIGQDDPEDRIPCSHCGEILGLDKFGKNKRLPFGRSRACLDCTRLIDEHRRLSKKSIDTLPLEEPL